ncbi:hypothetical protein [Sphingobacterium faecium]|uniref:Uncharacterized protein n=2 Tax=Bacteroidota/Chlorobiota group TaxID=68336 RepID=A0A8H9G152_9SPHI|nr:hypothetical protein [Sphingobacterium faecium]WGQ12830.1 hypothetical protein QG727_12415 [Sphingobacterium faecium]GGE19441.1 hypothetical protein GCM10011516_16430 [Sphingobacterium soli]
MIPIYILEEYRGHIIASHKNNVPEKSTDNLIITYRKEDFPEYGYIVGLDDSKMSGRRKAFPHNMDDAKGYIDWLERKPEIEIDGTKYLFDINQLALVEKDRPEERKLFFDEMKDYGTHYEFVYNRNSKLLDAERTENGIDAYITGKHSFAIITVPRMGDIDPTGMSSKYNCSLDYIRQNSDLDIMIKEAYDMRVNKGMLPTIEIEEHTFYVDLRMDKLRPKDDFLSNGIGFSQIEDYFNDTTEKYVIPYNPQKKELGEIDYETITKIPKDLVVVEIPSEIKMDPIGWNRLHGFDLKDGLRETGLQMNFTAKQAKWEDIYVPQKIKENLAQLKREKQQNKPIKTSQHQQSKKGRKM